MTNGRVLELDISLNGIEPRIWRRALVSSEDRCS